MSDSARRTLEYSVWCFLYRCRRRRGGESELMGEVQNRLTEVTTGGGMYGRALFVHDASAGSSLRLSLLAGLRTLTICELVLAAVGGWVGNVECGDARHVV